jgi:hypothetical protein
METEALNVATRSVAETKNLLESLIVSSESFDYFAAKKALRKLQRTTRELGKLQAELHARNEPKARIIPIDFQQPVTPAPTP